MARYVSLDIETTGLDPKTCDMVEFAAVIDDLKNQKPLEQLPSFHRYIYRPIYKGEPYALAMHKELFSKIDKWQKGKESLGVASPEQLMEEFYSFLYENYDTGNPIYVTAAGKNFANFDLRFIERLPQKEDSQVRFNHRVMDPAMLYFNPGTDAGPPGMIECMKRAGIDGSVAHTAYEDALMVISLLRKKFPVKP